jgi:hypothetical protein
MQTEVSNPPEYASTALSFTMYYALRLIALHLYFLVRNDLNTAIERIISTTLVFDNILLIKVEAPFAQYDISERISFDCNCDWNS